MSAELNWHWLWTYFTNGAQFSIIYALRTDLWIIGLKSELHILTISYIFDMEIQNECWYSTFSDIFPLMTILEQLINFYISYILRFDFLTKIIYVLSVFNNHPIFWKMYHVLLHVKFGNMRCCDFSNNNPQNLCLVAWLLPWNITFWVKYILY